MSDAPRFPFKIGNALMCEDVRPEMYGKYTIFGTYGGDILVPHFGGNIRAALYIELLPLIVKNSVVEIHVNYAKQPVLEAHIEVQVQDLTNPAILSLPTFPIPISQDGSVSVRLKCDGIYRQIINKRVRMAAPGTFNLSSASPPPSLQSPSARKAKAKRP